MAANLERRPRQCAAQPRRIVMIARDAVHRFAELAQHARKVRVALGFIVDDVAAAHQRVDIEPAAAGVRQHALHRRQRRDPTQSAVRAGEQVRVGKLQQAYGGVHLPMLLAGLNARVMHFKRRKNSWRQPK
jgi:hypothetical protein